MTTTTYTFTLAQRELATETSILMTKRGYTTKLEQQGYHYLLSVTKPKAKPTVSYAISNNWNNVRL